MSTLFARFLAHFRASLAHYMAGLALLLSATAATTIVAPHVFGFGQGQFTGEQHVGLYGRLWNSAISSPVHVAASTPTTIAALTLLAPATNETQAFAATVTLRYDESDASVSLDGGSFAFTGLHEVVGSFVGGAFCAQSLSGSGYTCATSSATSIDTPLNGATPSGVLLGATMPIVWTGTQLAVQVTCPVPCYASVGWATGMRGLDPGAVASVDSGVDSSDASDASDAGDSSDAADAADANDSGSGDSGNGNVASIVPGAGPLAGGQSVTITGLGLGPTCLMIDGVAPTGCSGSATTQTCTTATAVGANSGNAIFGSVTCGGGTPLANAYLYLTSVAKAFLRADAIATSGSNITSATDLQGNAAWTQGTTGNQPTLTASCINSEPCFTFSYSNAGSSVNQYLSGPSLASLTQGEEQAVYIVNSNSQDSNFGTGTTGYLDFGGTVYSNFGSSTRQTVGTGTIGSAIVTDIVSQSANWVYKQNGTTLFSTGTNTVAFSSVPSFGSALQSFACSASFAELLLTTAPQSAGDLVTMKAYHNVRYGLNF